MTPEASENLHHLWPEWKAEAPRRAAADFRRRLYVGQYKVDARRLVRERIRDAESAEEVCKFVNTAHGLVGAVADTCAVVYQRGVRRELAPKVAGDAAAQAFAERVAESGIAAMGTSINALAWAVGPVLCIPTVEDVDGERRLVVTPVTADRYCVRRHPAAPDSIRAALFERPDGIFVEVDGQRWRYWTRDGAPLDGGKHDAAHGLGRCPAAAVRARPWLPYDWSGSTDHAGLSDAALEVAFLHALGRWVRTQNAADLVVILAPPEKYAKLQALGHPSRPLVFDCMPGEVNVDVKARQVNPAHYLSEIQAVVNAAVARYGIPPSAITFDNSVANWGTLSIAVTPGALALQRDAQAPLLREGEVALWRLACDVVRASDHPLAAALPERDVVRKALRVTFPDLADPAEQVKRMAALKEQLPLGLSSPVDVLMAARPELTRAEAEEELQNNLANYIATIEPLVNRNVSADPERGAQTIAQVQGREGGRATAANRERALVDGPPSA